jgi:YHS domain-containing protein
MQQDYRIHAPAAQPKRNRWCIRKSDQRAGLAAGAASHEEKAMSSATFSLPAVAVALVLGAALMLAVLAPGARAKEPPVYTGLVKGVAVGGYDPVAYFTEGRAVPGSKDITLEHEGATWRFATEASREAFKADPTRYAPQYGGYCAYAVANGYTAKGDPEAWSVHEGRLYLNYDRTVRSTWEKDKVGYIAKAEKNWPGVLD